MGELLRFLEQYEVWIYALVGIISLIYFRKLVQSWQQYRGTVFGMEREQAHGNFIASLTILVLLGLLVVGEFVIVSFVVPGFPERTYLPTPTLNPLATATATLPAAPGGTPTPSGATPTPLVTEGCQPGRIEWITPVAGAQIKGNVELKGTVNVPNLGFYKYEFSQPAAKTWTTIAAGNSPKVNGVIGFWNTSTLVPGDYLLRLVVVDNKNQTLPACIVPVRVMAP
ncbi:MAG TPA: hypothetical protein VIO61_13855 [Anaerolineaceae bacterium]